MIICIVSEIKLVKKRNISQKYTCNILTNKKTYDNVLLININTLL